MTHPLPLGVWIRRRHFNVVINMSRTVDAAATCKARQLNQERLMMFTGCPLCNAAVESKDLIEHFSKSIASSIILCSFMDRLSSLQRYTTS